MNITLESTTSRHAHPLSATIDHLGWMAGNWLGNVDGDPVDEHWSSPGGGTMVGMFRWLKDGNLFYYELLAIEPEASGLVLRLKHFNRGLIGWEEKGMAIAYPLVEIGNQTATFERGGSFRSTRFVYRRVAVDELVVVTEDRKGDDVTCNEFRYRRSL
jgi:Domain of unknown function (DUF6265)